MQVQHEARLLEPTSSSLSGVDDAIANNRSLDLYSLASQHSNLLCPIERLASGGVSNSLLATHLSQSNQIVLFDSRNHQRRDRFPLKACDKKYSRHSFQVSAMDFSRDGQRLAVGQTDCIIYVYKLAQSLITVGSLAAPAGQQSASESPVNLKATTISGKFATASPITCLVWSEMGILFGSQDGRVRLILSPSNHQRLSNASFQAQNGPTSSSESQAGQSSSTAARVIQLFQAQSSSVPMALFFRAPLLLIGQLDCKVQILLLANEQPQDSSLESSALSLSSRRNSSVSGTPSVRQTLNISHSCPPLYVSCLSNSIICCAGSDGRIAFHSVRVSQNSLTGALLQVIDLQEDIQAADLSPINELLAVATRRRLMFIKFDQESNSFRLQPAFIEFKALFGLSTVRWLRDGAQLALGYANCALDLFKCSWQKQAINEQLDICHIARNRVRITDRERNLLATYKTQHDIKRINILDRNQSVIIWTSGSLLLARLNDQLYSELAWPLVPSGKSARFQPKFLFEPSGFVLIYFEPTSECHLFRLGDSHAKFSWKLPHLRRTQLSARQYPPMSELCGSNQVGSSPSRNRPGSTSHSARTDSAHSQRNLLSSEPALEDPLHLSGEQNPPKPLTETQCELLAYICGDQQTLLNIVDLKDAARAVHSQEFVGPLARVEFSCTANYLIVMQQPPSERLHLLRINTPDGSGTGRKISVVSLATLDSCHFADWIPATDALVVQINWTIEIRYDLAEFGRLTKIDCRGFNYARRAPLLDLSLEPDRAQTYPKCQRIDCETNNQCDLLVLSSGQQLRLDRVKRRFYADLTRGKLESAFEWLQKQPSDQQRRPLLVKLGWKAIKRADCELAIRIFTKTGHSSLVSYLEKCRSLEKRNGEKAAEELGLESSGQTSDEGGLMLAKLCGDWRKFEELAGSQELILDTYKRLNKWLLCSDYLTRTQQFRQRDIAELERQQWLVSRGRFKEAAQSRVDYSADLTGALQLLLDQNKFSDAADLMLEQQKTPLNEGPHLTQTSRQIRQVADSLIRDLAASGDHFRAALLSEKILANKRQAVDLYAKAHKFEMALSLAEPDGAEARRLHLDYAHHLEEQLSRKLIGKRRSRLALEHFREGRDYCAALKLAAQYGLHKEAFEILRDHWTDLVEVKLQYEEEERESFLRNLAELAERFSSLKEAAAREVAIKLFELAESYEKMVELSIEAGELGRAYEVALTKLYGDDTRRASAKFADLAAKLASESKDRESLSRAEQIYLLLGQSESAIEMYRKLGMHDEMLELVERHQPDQLESSLLQLARSLESAGRLEDAERYLIRASASEWTGVVRMYRLAQRWPDAFRVARANCLSDEDPLLVQLAYWWAKSLLVEGSRTGEPLRTDEERLAEARKLLNELKLARQVVEFCCETKNYLLALDLVSGDAQLEHLQRDIVVRYAAHLERQHKFVEAERVLLDNRLVELAVRMRLDNDQHQEAVQLIERQISEAPEQERARLVSLLNQTLIQSGRRLAESVNSNFRRTPPIMRQRPGEEAPANSSSLQLARQMFLRAQKPELAIEMYQSLGLWQEAIQVAQRFAPRLLEDVERALDAQVSEDIGPILSSSQSAQNTGSSEEAQKDGEQIDRPPIGEVVALKQAASSGQPADEIWSQLCGQMNEGRRREVRASVTKYLGLLSHLEMGTELARHLEQLAGILPLTDGRMALILSLQENEASLSRLCSRVFRQADWAWNGWPSLVSLLARQLLDAETAGERDLKLRKRCLIALHVSTHGALEQLLHKVASGDETRTSEPGLASRLGAPSKQSTALFARKPRRAPRNGPLAGRPSGEPGEPAPRRLTIKKAEGLLKPTGGEPGRSQQVENILDLLAKLSFGLLRDADQIDAANVLLAAGRWQLALGRRKLARDLWSALIELLGGPGEQVELERATADSLRSSVGRLVDLPESLLLPARTSLKRDAARQQELAEVRQWLLESLIGGRQSSGRAESALPAGWAKLGSQPLCLICALGAEPSSCVPAPSKSLALRRAEFCSICELAGLELEVRNMESLEQVSHLLRQERQTVGKEIGWLRLSIELAVNLVRQSP